MEQTGRAFFVGVALVAAASTAGAQTTVAELITNHVDDAALPGSKDTHDLVRKSRFGYASWYSGELETGYPHEVSELADMANYPPPGLELLPSANNIYGWLDPPFNTIPNQAFFVAWKWIMYRPDPGVVPLDSELEVPADITDAFPPNVEFWAAQNTVLSPIESSGSWAQPSYMQLEAWQDAAPPGVTFTQNIGFANQFNFATGEFQLNHQSAMLDFEGQPFWFDIAPVSYKRFVMSLEEDPVAQLTADSIEARVGALDADRMEYFTVSGEMQMSLALKNPVCDCLDEALPCDVDAYEECLENLARIDYSAGSILHFQHWLERKYGSPATMALPENWDWPWLVSPSGCSSIIACPSVDPLNVVQLPAGDLPDLRAVLEDWLEFKDDQFFGDAYSWQYRVAKAAALGHPDPDYHDTPCYTLYTNALGVDRGCLFSDGVGVNAWLSNNEAWTLGDPFPSPMKKLLLHGVSFGEALNLPFFGFPRVCEVPGADPCVPISCPATPEDFGAPEFDELACYSLFREFMALGMKSVGFAYFEHFTDWNIRDGVFPAEAICDWPNSNGPNLLEVMADEAADAAFERAFATPWRAPILVHTGNDADVGKTNAPTKLYRTGPTADLIRTLSSRHLSFSLFSLLDGFDDLWLPSARDLLVFSYPSPEEVADVLARGSQSSASSDPPSLLIMTGAASVPEFQAQLAPSQLIGGALPFPGGWVQFLDLNGDGGLPLELLWLSDDNDSPASMDLLFTALELLSLWFESARRPVHLTSLDDISHIDVTTASDGLNFFVSLTNGGTTSANMTVTMDPDAVPGIPSYTSIPSGAVNLSAGESTTLFFRADVPHIDDPTDADWTQAIADAKTALTMLPTTVGTKTADEIIAQLENIDANAPANIKEEKILAGLLRLERMLFVGASQATDTGGQAIPYHLDVEVRDLHGTVAGATAQAEWIYQDRTRSPFETSTAQGIEDWDVTPLAENDGWDFIDKQYQGLFDSGGAPRVAVEVQVQHPSYHSQAATVVEFVNGVIP